MTRSSRDAAANEQQISSLRSTAEPIDPAAKRREIFMFVFLAVVIWPILTVAIVGGYGFLVWMYQLIAGPPGPPGV